MMPAAFATLAKALATFSGSRGIYLVTVMDDYSRFILAHRLQQDMTSDSFIEVVQDAVDRTAYWLAVPSTNSSTVWDPFMPLESMAVSVIRWVPGLSISGPMSLSHRLVGELSNTGVGGMRLNRGWPVQLHRPLVGPQRGRLLS